MNFVIGVIGLIIIVAASSYRQTAKEIRDKKFQEEFIRDTIGMSDWIKMATDRDNEKELLMQTTITEICDVVRSLEHFNLVKEFLHDEDPSDENINWFLNKYFYGMYGRIALGLHGKLSIEDASMGIQSPGVWDKDEINKWLIHYDIMMWLNNQLHKHGISEKMRFHKGMDGVSEEWTKIKQGLKIGSAIEDNEIEVIGGRYYWNPARKQELYIAPVPRMTVGRNKNE